LYRAIGAPLVLVAIQLSAMGLYLPPVLKIKGVMLLYPPHMIISLPVHTAVWFILAVGAPTVLVVIQLSVPGLYFPPVFKKLVLSPPQITISVPVHTAV
jgi:hypothetical protein